MRRLVESGDNLREEIDGIAQSTRDIAHSAERISEKSDENRTHADSVGALLGHFKVGVDKARSE